MPTKPPLSSFVGTKPPLSSFAGSPQVQTPTPTPDPNINHLNGFSVMDTAKKFSQGIQDVQTGAFKGAGSTIATVPTAIGKVVQAGTELTSGAGLTKSKEQTNQIVQKALERYKTMAPDDPQRAKLRQLIDENMKASGGLDAARQGLTDTSQAFADKPGFLKPEGTAQKIGYGAEKIAEFMAPGAAIAKGELALKNATTALPKVVGYGTRVLGGAALEGVSGAGVTAAQGGDLKDIKNAGILSAVLAVPFKAFGVAKEGTAAYLKESAEKKASQALGATTIKNKQISEKVVPELLKRRVTFLTRGGLAEKAANNADNVGEQIGQAFDNLPPETKSVVTPIFKELEDAKSQFLIKGTTQVPEAAAPQYKALQNIQNEILGLAQRGTDEMANTLDDAIHYVNIHKALVKEGSTATAEQLVTSARQQIAMQMENKGATEAAKAISNIDISSLGAMKPEQALDELGRLANDATKQFTSPTISAESLRSFRQILDNVIKKSSKTFGLTGEETAKMAAQKETANAIRQVLAKDHPDIAILNKEFSFWQNVQDVVEATVQRTKSQGTPLGETIAEGAGAAAGLVKGGGVGSALLGAVGFKLVKNVVQSPAWRMASAILRNELAEALVKGNKEQVLYAIGRIMSAEATGAPSRGAEGQTSTAQTQ